MTKKITIAIDAMGGENAPKKNHNYQLFEQYLVNFFNFCFELDHETMIKKAIEFKV